MPGERPFSFRAYRLAVRCYPPTFRRSFEREMLRDFAEGWQDAAQGVTPGTLAAFRMRIASDFATSLAVEWWRSGWPVLLVLAMSGPILLMVGLGSIWPLDPLGTQAADVRLNADLLGLLLVTTVILLFLMLMLFITSWCNRRLMFRRRG